MGKNKKSKHNGDDSMIDEQPSSKKSKLNVTTDGEDDEQVAEQDGNGVVALVDLPYADKLPFTSIIAQPMASKKLAKRIFKLIKKASKQKTFLRAGLRDVQMRIRKGERGLAIFAGDVTPIEVMCHLPAVCEEENIPYAYVPLRADISAAMQVKRPCLMVMVRKHDDYSELYEQIEEELKALPLPISV